MPDLIPAAASQEERIYSLSAPGGCDGLRPVFCQTKFVTG